MTAKALQDKKYSLAWKLTYDSFQLWEWVARMLCFAEKMTFHIPHVPYYKYPYTHEM